MGAGCKANFKGEKKSYKSEIPFRRKHEKVNLEDLDKLLLPSSERQSVTQTKSQKAGLCFQYWTYDCKFNIEE